MRRIATGAVVALGMGLAACGGDDGPTEQGFRTAATKACHDGNARLLGLPLPRTETELAAFDERIERSERRLFADLRAVEAPAELRDRYERALATGDRAEAHDGLMALGLGDCAAAGLTGVPGGGDLNAQLTAQCQDVTIAIERAVDEEVGRTRPRKMADALRSLHRQIEYDRPPAPARALFTAAVADVRSAAGAVDELAAGTLTEADDRRYALLFGRIAATWDVLNVDACEDVWTAMQGKADE